MNIEIICPVCGKHFEKAVEEHRVYRSHFRVTCSFCRKSFFLERAQWRKVVTPDHSIVDRVPTRGQYTGTPKKRRSKWGKRAYGEMTKRIKRKEDIR